MRYLEPADEAQADVYIQLRPAALDLAWEYHVMRHHALCGRAVSPARGWTWARLARELEQRFPPHLWHPCHLDAYEQVHPPRPETAMPAAPPETPTWRKPGHQATPQLVLLREE